MTQYEYKHVRHTYGGWAFFSKKKYHERLMPVLEQMGREGWELKGVWHEGFESHIHMVFGREVSAKQT